MRLRTIAEAVVQDAGKALGDLIKFVYELGPDAPELKALEAFLTKPSARGWEQVRWIVDSAIKTALKFPDPSYRERAKQWTNLKRLTSPVAAASVYAVDPKDARGTPLQKVALSHPQQERLMSSLGPQGLVGTVSSLGEVPAAKAKTMLKKQAADSKANLKAIKNDIPGAKIVKKF
jgi:hypothetical protein